MKLILLAKVPELDPATKDFCGFETRQGAGGRNVKVPREAKFAYFAQGFVNADLPRNAAYTEDITRATVGWALADEGGNVLAEFKTAAEADDARSKATQKLEIAVPEAKAEPKEAEAEKPAKEAAK